MPVCSWQKRSSKNRYGKMDRMKNVASEEKIIISLVESSGHDKMPIWSIPPKKNDYIEIRDLFWSATFGICQEKLDEITQPIELVVDFSRICWIDPFPLLGIFIAVNDNWSAISKCQPSGPRLCSGGQPDFPETGRVKSNKNTCSFTCVFRNWIRETCWIT